MTRALTVAIQAGGKSSRMGTDKAFALLDGKPLIEHVLERVRQIDPAEILIISKTPERFSAYPDVRLLPDYTNDRGPLGGLFIALNVALHKNILMVGCDMPFLNPALLELIADMQKIPPYHAIVPRWDGQAQGLHALYHQTCFPEVRQHLSSEHLSLNGLLQNISDHYNQPSSLDGLPVSGVRWLDALEYAHLDAEGRSFTNINTPDDLRAAQSKLET